MIQICSVCGDSINIPYNIVDRLCIECWMDTNGLETQLEK